MLTPSDLGSLIRWCIKNAIGQDKFSRLNHDASAIVCVLECVLYSTYCAY